MNSLPLCHVCPHHVACHFMYSIVDVREAFVGFFNVSLKGCEDCMRFMYCFLISNLLSFLLRTPPLPYCSLLSFLYLCSHNCIRGVRFTLSCSFATCFSVRLYMYSVWALLLYFCCLPRYQWQAFCWKDITLALSRFVSRLVALAEFLCFFSLP